MKKILFFLLLSQAAAGQVLPDEVTGRIGYRNIGPFRTGAWITGFAIPEKGAKDHLYTFYVATRNGGLWKTDNNGTTFRSIFPHHHTIGAVAVAPSDPARVWVGTGESYIARSSYSGDGVYFSADTGRTWKHAGLKETQHIVRVLVHPRNPDIVYVASPGHLFTPNAERGVFKTTDGGRSWKKTFFISDTVGVIDLVMHPTNPDILFAAAYDKKRTAWTLESGGPQSAIYKTADGGRSWKKLTSGLPSGNIGRIGIDVCRAQPQTLYAVVENLNPKPGGPAAATIGGEVYRSDDGGGQWRKVNRAEDNVGGKAAYSFNQITVHPVNPDKVYITGISVSNSGDGGKTWRDLDYRDQYFFPGAFGDVRTFWIDHKNPDRMFFGSDGGVHISYDAGRTSDYYDNLPLGEIYAVGYDMEEPYNVYAGLQDHESWKGPSNGWSGVISLENWVTVGSDDGMYNEADPADSRWVYNTGQFGIHRRVDQQSGTRANIQPRAGEGQAPYRFNWCTPMVLSPHNSKTLYTGAQLLLRSRDQGTTWEAISPDLTTNDPQKINGKGHMQYCTITTISESPAVAGLIWVGTDDGRVWVTRNEGRDWTELTPKLDAAGGPSGKWVSRVLASAHAPGTAYVTKSGFREDDFRPYLLKTTDYGNSWQLLTGGLNDKPLNVVVEDPVNPQLLFAGNDAGVYVSVSGGNRWQPLAGNMPVVPVHDLKIHPREKDLIVGTYGRGLYIADISWLQELGAAVLQQPAHLFAVEPRYQRIPRTFGGNYHLYGNRHIEAPNEPNGLVVNFLVKEAVADSAVLRIEAEDGRVLHRRHLKAEKGLNTAVWNFSTGRPGSAGGTAAAGNTLAPGPLVVVLEVAGKRYSTRTAFKGPKGWPVP